MIEIPLVGKRISLGGGEYPKQGFLNIDNSTINPINGHSFKPDILHDLNDGIPFPDNFIDEVEASHFLEHVKDPVFLLKEIVRVCKNDSKVTIIVPVHDMIPAHITDMSKEWFLKNLPAELRTFDSIEERQKDLIDEVYGNRTITELELHLVVKK